tara:strand:+ start:164 stop:634 length:471 start_codon:yes stop_codon:yes gene_type:complete
MILILVILIIIIILILVLRKLKYQHFENPVLDKQTLNDIEKSVSHIKKELNLSDNEIDLESNSLDEYLNTLISYNGGKDVNEDKYNGLPFIDNNNYVKYNHELNLLLNSKKIKQFYVINILKNKIKYLSESLKNIKDIKDDRNTEIERIKCQKSRE